MDFGHRAKRAGLFLFRGCGSGRFSDRGCPGINDFGLGKGKGGDHFFLFHPVFFRVLPVFAGRFPAHPCRYWSFRARGVGEGLLDRRLLFKTFLFQPRLAADAKPFRDCNHDLPAEFDRVHAGHEDETGEVKKGQEDGCADDPEQPGEHGFPESKPDPSARAEDVEVFFP